MATDTERLVLQLSADMRSFQREMLRAAGEADRAANRIERRFQQQNQRVVRGFQDFGNQVRTVLATIGVGLVVRDVVELGDTWTRVGNALAFAGVEADQLATIQQTVADIASRTRSDLEATADLFARMLRSSEDLGASMSDVAAATEIVSKALAGASQSERAGAIRQLGQALGAGVLAGDELRSILENSRVLAEAIADEFGVGVGQLRELGKQGALESRRVFEAIINAGDEIEAAFARTTFTVADEFTRLRTEAARFVGTNDQTSRSVRSLAGFIKILADNFDLLASTTIVVASVLGGALAGQAIARLITALTTLTITAGGARAALAFFGGPLGLILTAAGAGMAVLATQTDIFADRAQTAARASDSLYSALQVIVSLGERLEETAIEGAKAAEATEQLGEAAAAANDALDDTSSGLDRAAGQMGVAERAARGLAEAEKQRAIATIAAALADQQAIVALERRNIRVREGQRRTLDAGVGVPGASRIGEPLDVASERLREANRESGGIIIQAQESVRILSDALAAVRTINSEFFAPAGAGSSESLRNQAAATASDLERAARALEELGRRAEEDLFAAIELEMRREQRDLEIELELARARGDERAIRALERRLEIERRIAELRGLQISGDDAARRAEAEVAALEQADMEGHFRRWFGDGVTAALEGDLDDFFEDWIRRAAARGLESALNDIANLVFRLFADAFSQVGGGGGGGFFSALASAFASSFGGGGFGGHEAVHAGGFGKFSAPTGKLTLPPTPKFAVPIGAMAAPTIQIIDAKTINFTGTSEELRQLEAAMAADRAARYSETAQIVNQAISRRHVGRR